MEDAKKYVKIEKLSNNLYKLIIENNGKYREYEVRLYVHEKSRRLAIDVYGYYPKNSLVVGESLRSLALEEPVDKFYYTISRGYVVETKKESTKRVMLRFKSRESPLEIIIETAMTRSATD